MNKAPSGGTDAKRSELCERNACGGRPNGLQIPPLAKVLSLLLQQPKGEDAENGKKARASGAKAGCFAGADALRCSLVRFKLFPEVIMVENGGELHVVQAANVLLFRNREGVIV